MAIAKEVWGLEPDSSTAPRPLDSYDDNNFFLPGRLPSSATIDGDKFLLKVQNGVESGRPRILAFQNEMMAALHGTWVVSGWWKGPRLNLLCVMEEPLVSPAASVVH